ncbi:MAG: monovalent cation/H+ antiporter subunit D family protein [Proteobacteria bacterium]|nr:monovalent cation/H+ antiporter subunit D family protein [Pseudomonadota bacterium]
METITSIKPLLAILVSTVAAILILLTGKKPNLRESWTFIAGIIKFLIVISMVPTILDHKTIEYTLLQILPGLEIKFKVDALGLFFALTASFLWNLASIYSIGYMRGLKEHAQTRYFACFAVSLTAALGVAFSANLFTLFLFYEILSLVTYPLVAHHEDDEGWAGGKKYFLYLVGSSKAFFLVAIVLTYVVAGNVDFTKGGLFPASASPVMLIVIYFLFLAGITKAGIMPFHSWLPSAMCAPTPVSGLLHAVAVVKVGVFSLLRVIFDVFGIELMSSLGLGIATAYLVSFTIITASIVAITQDNLKARLAFSTVSQLSYIILGAAMLTKSSMLGGIMHIANHALAKITLFFCAGSIYVSSHLKKISDLGGIAKKMPWTMAAFFLGSMGMIGIPPAGGFVSKWYLLVGSMEANQIAILIVLLVSTLLNAGYFLPIIYTAYFEKPKDPETHAEIKEHPLCVIPLMITACLSIAVGLYPNFFMSIAKEVVKWI